MRGILNTQEGLTGGNAYRKDIVSTMAGILHVPLDQRPVATTITVRALIEKVQNGQVRLPKFQRPLRWAASDVVKLFDSVWRGYPIGSLLFWVKAAPEDPEIKVGGALVSAPEYSSAWWIVDGQQRATALAAALLKLDHGGDTRWNVRFDPKNQVFLEGKPPLGEVGQHVPLVELGDLRRLGRWLRENSLEDSLVERVETTQQRILDYSIPIYLIETGDEEALRGVFARLNSSGARMRADEIFQALLSKRTAHPELDLNELQTTCDVEGFGQPPRAEIMKAVLAMSGHDPSRRLEEAGDRAVSTLIGSDEAKEALTRTVRFLQTYAKIPHVSLIPYPVVFIVLSRWFYLFPGTFEERDEEQGRADMTLVSLAHWVWRGVVLGAHQRAEVSKMREQVRALKPDDEQGSLDRLLTIVGAPKRVDWQLKAFHSRNAQSRTEILALLHQGPQSEDGPVSIGAILSQSLASGGRIAREVFASPSWQELDEEGQTLARTAANRVLLEGTHTGLHTTLRKWKWPEHATRLQSHLIDRESLEALVDKKILDFLRLRTQTIKVAVEGFLQERAGIDYPRLRPVEAYSDDDVVLG